MNYKNSIRRIVTPLLLIAFSYYFFNNWEDFYALKAINPGYLVLAIIGHFAIVFTNGLLIKWILEPYDKHLGVIESYYLSLYSSIGNFFLPIGSGMAMRAVYLKKRLKFNYKTFMTTLYGNYMIVFFCNGILGLLALAFLGNVEVNRAIYTTLVGVFAAMSTGTFILMVHLIPQQVFRTISKHTGSVGKKLVGVISGWEIVAKQRKLLVKMSFATILGFLALMVVNASAMAALNLEVRFWPIVLYSAIGSIALLLNFTPGSLGIKEGLYIFSSSALGFTVPQILAISIIDRGTKFIVLVGGWLLMYTNQLPGSKDFRAIVKGSTKH
jgi:uncharacterized protein (TIRG00374 family)